MPNSIEYSDPPSAVMRKIIRAGKAGIEAGGEEWIEYMLPRHFDEDAGERYGYTKRDGEGEPAYVYNDATKYGRVVTRKGFSRRIIKNPAYWWRKKREGHGTQPLVYSGISSIDAISGASVRATEEGGVITGVVSIPVPSYFFQSRARNDGTKPPDKVKELTTILPSEQGIIEAVIRRTVEEIMSGSGRSKTVRIAA